MDKIALDMGLRIKKCREKFGYSQTRLAELLEMSQNHISQIERGVRGLSRKMLPALAAALNTTVAYLMGETDDPNPSPAGTTGRDKCELRKSKRRKSEKSHNHLGVMVFEYSEGNKKMRITLPTGTTKEEMQAAIAETVRAVSGEIVSKDEPWQSLKPAASGDIAR